MLVTPKTRAPAPTNMARRFHWTATPAWPQRADLEGLRSCHVYRTIYESLDRVEESDGMRQAQVMIECGLIFPL